jgi:endonuclease YncB( thermonuclease family)
VPRVVLSALGVLVALLTLPAPARAATGPCLPDRPGGPPCTVWTGTVTFVADGDTLAVDVAGDGTATPARVRLAGVQAMEHSVYSTIRSRRRGACHALRATDRLERLVRASRGRVRLAAQHPASHSGGRLRRAVAVRVGGRWVDAARLLLAGGHALWLPNHVEHAGNDAHRRAALAAAAARRGIWAGDVCRRGPAPGARLRVEVRWDADGDDGRNLNGEWIRVVNDGDAAVGLGGWWVRDSALRRFTFPAGAAVGAHDAVTVHVGRGSASATDFHWGLDAPAFENATGDGRGLGDGGYLFDPDGDLRGWDVYPR